MIHKKILPVKTMIELENWIDSLPAEISNCFSSTDLPKRLGLKIEYVDEKILAPDVEAELQPICDTKYNGLIKVSNKQKNVSFPYMHEIIHYLRDVGVGNKVNNVFTRKKGGKTATTDEQYVNYLTASAVMRYQEIKRLLEQYDNTKPKMDEIEFVDSLCERFKQDKVAVLRRIVEVRKLRKARVGRASM